MSYLALEQRIAFDAAVASTVVDAAAKAPATAPVEAAPSAASDSIQSLAAALQSIHSAAAPAQDERHEAAYVESNASDQEAGDIDRGVEVILIDRNLDDSALLIDAAQSDAVIFEYDSAEDSAASILDRVLQWTEQSQQKIQSLFILSHGTSGAFELGNQWVTASTIVDMADDWNRLSSSFTADADIYILGCNVGAGGAGSQQLLDHLSLLTETEVYASTDVTGVGGDWAMEIASTGASLIGDAALTQAFDMDELTAANVSLAWYNASWQYRQTVTVDEAMITGTSNLSNFSVLVSITNTNLRSVSNGGHVGQTDGGDFVFTSSDGTTKLDHEIESYDATTGTLKAWVQVSTLTYNANTSLYVYYGNAGAADQWNVSGTWDSIHRGVWHLSNNTLTDSTSNANNGTNVGSTDTSGVIEEGRAFNGSNQNINVADANSLDLTQLTISAWINPTVNDNNWRTIVGKGNDGNYNYWFGIKDRQLNFWVDNTEYDSNVNLTLNTWSHVAASFDDSTNTLRMYVNGTQVYSTTSASANPVINTLPLYIGRSDLNNEWWQGSLDEVRVDATIQSASWIQAQYLNQNAPGTYVTLASEEGAPAITSNGGGTTASISVAENSTAVTTVAATDPGAPPQTLTYSIAGGVDAARFSIDGSTGVLTFATAPNFESPTDIGVNNVYDVIVQVSDGALTDTQAIAVTVTDGNDAPVLADTALTLTVAEDAAAPSGAVGSLISVFTGGITDADSGAVKGIAITASNETNGTWYYSTNGGTNWTAVGTVSAAQSLLLADNASTRLYFQPSANYSGSAAAALTIRGWDRTSGSAGTKVDTSSNGGTTAFSSATDVIDVTVTAVNDAPVLDNARTPVLATQNEDSGAPSGAVGTLISSLVDFASPSGQVDNVTDIDSGALLGIAITAADTANGTWHYSINGGANWSALGAVANNSARLLAADANTRLYFQPSADYNGTLASAITFRAWDRSSGANGGLADTSSNGGTTAFSSATDIAAITVAAVNDAPVLANTALTLTVAEDAGAPSGAVGSLVSAFTGGITDVDSGAVKGIAIVASNETNGTWYYSTNGGANWTAVGTVTAAQSLLLADNASTRLYFAPAADYSGSAAAALTVRGWDQTSGLAGTKVDTSTNGGTTAFSSATDVVDVTVTAVNDAPVLADTALTLMVSEDAGPPSGAVGSLVGAFTGGISDIDSGALKGIAIVASNETNGTWYYSTNGGTNWTAVGTVSAAQSLLLADNASTRLYFQPSANYNGTSASALTVRGWDQTSGAAGAKVDTSTNGDATAFSAATDVIDVTVTETPLVDSTSSGTADGVLTLTISHTTSGSDRLMLVTIATDPHGSIGGSITYNGVALTFVGSRELGHSRVELWSLLAPSIGTHDVVVTMTGTSYHGMVTGVVTFTGVDQTAPLANFTSNAGSSATASATVNSEVGDLVFSAVHVHNGTSAAPGVGQTEHWDRFDDKSNSSGTTKAGAATVANSWTVNNDDWTTFGVSIQSSSNDAPVLDAGRTPVLVTQNEDSGAPSGAVGTLISSLVDFASPSGQVDNVTDADAGALLGIAITAADTTNGTWHYSIDGGANWSALGAVANNNARLLAADASTRIYFQPNADYNGTLASAITFRAWDRSSGANGGQADATTNGGATAFSGATDVAAITVTAVNDAPVLADTALTLTVAEDAGAPSGAVGSLISAFTGGITDADSGAVKGIAITASNETNGTWYYSTNGGTNWTAVGTVSAAQSLLLADNVSTRLYFAPNADYNGTSAGALTIRGWDQTSGSAGSKVDTSTTGGSTAFSAATDMIDVTVTAVNDAPVLADTALTLTVAEDAGAPSGAVGSLVSAFTGGITDVDSGAVKGIAIVASNETNGTWYYSTNDGTNWTAVGTVSAAQSLLLADNVSTRLYFQPNANYNGTSAGALTIRGWDQTSGSAGSKVDTSSNGGTTAFSSATDVVDVNVTAVNDAPVLDAGRTPVLATQNEDSGAPSGAVGTLVSSLVDFASPSGQVDNVTDADTGALLGIAITAADTANGTWHYSTNSGVNWNALGAVSGASARLLAADANTRVYFQPNADYNGNLANAIAFRAWDRSSGANGALADTTANGGTTAFSSATDIAAITITAVNDAPVLDNSGTMTLTTITEDQTANSGDSVFAIVASAGGNRITDVDSIPLEGIAITSITSGNGTWQYSIDGGGSWSDIGAVANNSALLLRETDRVRFVPDGSNADTATITFRAWDETSGAPGAKVDASINGGVTAFSAATETAAITVTAANDAPVLDNSGIMTLTTIAEDQIASSGDSVFAIIASAGGNRVTDVDSFPFEGMAITDVNSGNGTWQYSIDGGGTWNNVGAVSDNSALLLRETDRVRFVPDGRNADNATVSFRAWDETGGAPGAKVDVSVNGGTTAFSAATETATITVTAVNDAPTISSVTVALPGTPENAPSAGTTVDAILASAGWADVDAGTMQGIAITAVTGNGAWQYSTDGATWTNFGNVSATNALLVSAGMQVRYVPADVGSGTAQFTFVAWDQTTGLASSGGIPRYGDTSASPASFSAQSARAEIAITAVPVPLPPPPPNEDEVPFFGSHPPPTESNPVVERLQRLTDAPVILMNETRDIIVVIKKDDTAPTAAPADTQPTLREEAAATDVAPPPLLVPPSGSLEIASEPHVKFTHVAFLEDLDRQLADLRDADHPAQTVMMQIMAGSSITLSVGYVAWVLRGGALMSALLSTMPVWQTFDPMTILVKPKSKDKKRQDESQVERMFDGAARSPESIVGAA